MPGVQKVVRDGNFLAVIAAGEYQAVKAMEVLAATATWEESETLPDQAVLYSWLKEQPKRVISIKDEKAAAAPAVKTLEAEYRRPYQMHASIGPSCAVGSVRERAADGMDAMRRACSRCAP